MARALRIQYPGAIYHAMNRGDQREDIFRDDADRERFLGTLTEVCRKTEWQVHAYCLMRNHFHLVVETPQPNLVFGMKCLLSGYGCYLKAAAQRPGWLRVDRLLGEKGIPKDSEAGRQQFARLTEDRPIAHGNLDLPLKSAAHPKPRTINEPRASAFVSIVMSDTCMSDTCKCCLGITRAFQPASSSGGVIR